MDGAKDEPADGVVVVAVAGLQSTTLVGAGAKDEPAGAVCRSVGGVNHNEGVVVAGPVSITTWWLQRSGSASVVYLNGGCRPPVVYGGRALVSAGWHDVVTYSLRDEVV